MVTVRLSNSRSQDESLYADKRYEDNHLCTESASKRRSSQVTAPVVGNWDSEREETGNGLEAHWRESKDNYQVLPSKEPGNETPYLRSVHC